MVIALIGTTSLTGIAADGANSTLNAVDNTPNSVENKVKGLVISQLGTDNTLVRVTDKSRYIILPIEEAMPDAKIDVLVNGHVERTFYARLANNTIDYSVPFDLTPYTAKGDVILNVKTQNDRASSREAGDYVCWEEIALSDKFETTNTEKYRPLFHHTPKYGWMNDPNGMFYKDGVWHLCFQHNPYGSKWQNMTWGHSTSRDLVHWEQQPNVIEPNGLGDVFSGSSAIDHDNTAGFGNDAIVSVYTSAGASQIQSLAYSTDNGQTFEIYHANPVIATKREARDPKIFFNPDINKWNLVLAGALDHEMLIFSSPNLKDWTYESAFGKGYGGQDGVWECPDLIKLPIRGTNKSKWVLICNINPGGPFGGSATQYFVGDFDGHKFTCDNAVNETRWMDYGKDHYAAVTWSDAPAGRHTTVAWMSNWQYANDVPTQQFRSANTLPRDLELFRAADGDLYLAVTPAGELDAMRGTPMTVGAMTPTTPQSFSLPKENDGVCEIVLSYNIKGSSDLTIELSNDLGEKVTMRLDARKRTFSMDRQESGLTKFSRHFPTATVAPLLTNKTEGSVRLYIDKCSVEAFDGQGSFAMTNLVFPTKPYNKVTVYGSDGKARVNHMNIYPLNIK
jgi:sucrose-6-phosphate hydrolase SacC (GH32 family)